MPATCGNGTDAAARRPYQGVAGVGGSTDPGAAESKKDYLTGVNTTGFVTPLRTAIAAIWPRLLMLAT
jgi:hypothetical protein